MERTIDGATLKAEHKEGLGRFFSFFSFFCSRNCRRRPKCWPWLEPKLLMHWPCYLLDCCREVKLLRAQARLRWLSDLAHSKRAAQQPPKHRCCYYWDLLLDLSHHSSQQHKRSRCHLGLGARPCCKRGAGPGPWTILASIPIAHDAGRLRCHLSRQCWEKGTSVHTTARFCSSSSICCKTVASRRGVSRRWGRY